MGKKVKKFVEPETVMTTAYEHGGLMSRDCGKCEHVPARLIREKDYQKLLRLARKAKGKP